MKLNFKKLGDSGDKVIILHGLFGMLDNWKSFARMLSQQGYQVYIIDLRNHGRSPWTNEMSIELMADDISSFCQKEGIEECHILGHSMGGKVAMQACLKYPHLFKSQVVIDIAPKRYKGSHHKVFETLLDLDLNNINQRSQAEESLIKNIEDSSVVQFLLKNLSRKRESGYAFKMNLKAIYESYQNILNEIDNNEEISYIPTLFVRGSLSKYILDEDFELIESIFLNSTLETIENAGHWVHADEPEELLELVMDFLDG